ncbi:uncharacterized protein LOC129960791 [Argiope bruennichi]|uniref:Proline-rich transmembrane protein 3/4 domain-containing protein n=1 Tax=Argiope bruennichi TaxID=94029 RepID=A0A8T0FHW3_ARGBR|nr:uncharacterized protein LOC129960791 [Argiope bruennichi]XP_055930412.1 uncharacterized protein LOC129960791 [Argiope bruennichi]XP_055930414.1 uncharacterized protein LOC129960791 [Argiope bruennichi]KAF8790022.1 hypothetical protein HNY73_005110 [Argiope bruennichi]
MLFPALLLITWVTVTIGAPSPPFPQKEAHLQIPVRDLPTQSSGESFRISPLIFRNFKKSIESRSRHPITTAVDLGRVFGGVRSSVSPGGGNVESKAFVGRRVMNFPSTLKGRNVPAPTNMNVPPHGNGGNGDKMTHVSHSRGHRDLHTKLTGNGVENGTLVYDHDYFHKAAAAAPKEKTDLTINDTAELSHIRNFEESSLNGENGKENIQNGEKGGDLEMPPSFNVTPSADNVFVPEKEFGSNKSDIHVEITESSKRNLQTPIKGSNMTRVKKPDKLPIERSDEVIIASNEDRYRTDKPLNTNFSRDEMNVASTSSNSIKSLQTLTTSASITINRNNLTTTQNPKTISSKENHNIFSNSSESPNFLSNHSQSIKELAANHFPMQQDGAYEKITSTSDAFPESSEGYGIKLFNDGSKTHSDELLKTISPTTVSSVVTTPDSHMNDPPFRGPNVPKEIEKFNKDKDETKSDYQGPNEIVESPSFQSANTGEEWNHAREIWGIAWDCHCYIIGISFAIIAFYSFISLLRIKTFVTLLATGYYTTTNLLICVTCLLRALYLLYDPYNLTGKYPVFVSQILQKITLPCLTSCFCILFLALLNFTNTQFLTEKFQRPSVLALLIIFIFSLFVTVEIAISNFYVSSTVLLVCYLIIISCSSLSSICYFFTFKRLHHRALRKQGEMIRLTFTKLHIDGAQLPKKLPKPTLGLAVKLVLVSSFIQILLFFLSPYAMIFLRGLFPKMDVPNPWFWWGYQLSCRILELLFCATMSFVATQPLKHFEIGDNRFCSILMWFPCSSFAECFRKEEVVDFEAHSDNYANPQGLRRTDFNAVASSRRLQTNSLPTFRTPLTEVDANLPMRTLPCTGRHTNHASALSLLSYYRSKRTLSLSTNEGLEDLERTLCNQTVSSSDGRNTLRPASMLYKDNGFIRFRRENDPEQPMEMSDEDDNTPEEADTSLEDADSTKANVGSSFHSLLEGDVVRNTLSPFFQIGYKRRFRKMSRVSIETTDYSADVSSDQLSNVVNLRNGLSSSALDFHTRKYGSTCSSESAANSFDVTFFLNSNSSPEMQTSPTSTTPASLNICSAYRSETEDDKTSSVEGHEVMLRSVSPIVKRASSGRLSLNLNLHTSGDANQSSGHVNVACGTEDITPDSAVYLDLHLSRENSISPTIPKGLLSSNLNLPPKLSPVDSFTKSTDGISPLSPETSSESQSISPTSQSLSELRTSNSYVVPRMRKHSRGLLCKLRGSTFSLNAAFYGYEPLKHVDSKKNRKKCERSSSDRRPLSEGQLELHPRMTPLGDFWHRATATGSGHLGDSGLLGDCGVALVDVASQTEDIDFSEYANKNCKQLIKGSAGIESQSLISPPLVKLKK